MKKVVRDYKVLDVIDISEITNESIVGIKWEEEGKSIVLPTSETEFAGFSFLDDYVPGKWKTPSKKEYVLKALKQGKNVEAFVFDTPKELAKWFSE